MSEKVVGSAARKAREIVKSDRLELMRAHADQQGTYCFFASLYEIAYHLHGDKMPPRYKQAEAEWLGFGTEDDGVAGGVNPKELINLIIRLANQFEIRVKKIYISSSVFPIFVADKVANARQTAEVAKEESPKIEYQSHAESQIGSPRSNQRGQRVIDQGWETVIAITFAGQTVEQPLNSLDSILIEEVAKGEENETIELSFPYMTVLVKKKDTANVN